MPFCWIDGFSITCCSGILQVHFLNLITFKKRVQIVTYRTTTSRAWMSSHHQKKRTCHEKWIRPVLPDSQGSGGLRDAVDPFGVARTHVGGDHVQRHPSRRTADVTRAVGREAAPNGN